MAHFLGQFMETSNNLDLKGGGTLAGHLLGGYPVANEALSGCVRNRWRSEAFSECSLRSSALCAAVDARHAGGHDPFQGYIRLIATCKRLYMSM